MLDSTEAPQNGPDGECVLNPVSVPCSPLRGIGALHVEPDQVLVRSRNRQAALAVEKRASLAGERQIWNEAQLMAS